MAHQRGAGAGQLRVLMRELEQVVDDGAAFGAVVAAQHFGGALMQLFDRRQPRQPEGFAPDHDRQRQRRGGGECQRDVAQRFAAREQILDQVDDAEARGRAAPARRRRSRTACPSESRGAPGRAAHRSAPAAVAGSASGVMCTVPRAGRPVSSGPITITPGSSSLNVAGRRCGVFSLIAVGLRSGTGGRGRGGCEAARARHRPCAPAAAAGSAGSGNRPVRKRCWKGRESRR